MGSWPNEDSWVFTSRVLGTLEYSGTLEERGPPWPVSGDLPRASTVMTSKGLKAEEVTQLPAGGGGSLKQTLEGGQASFNLPGARGGPAAQGSGPCSASSVSLKPASGPVRSPSFAALLPKHVLIILPPL